jgi:four helix bundle protein
MMIVFKKNYRIIDQLNGSSGSIMDNIAAGFERGTRKEFIQFPGYAKGSCGEVRSQLCRALYRTYIDRKEFEELYELATTISSMIQKFISYLLKSSIEGSRKNTT